MIQVEIKNNEQLMEVLRDALTRSLKSSDGYVSLFQSINTIIAILESYGPQSHEQNKRD